MALSGKFTTEYWTGPIWQNGKEITADRTGLEINWSATQSISDNTSCISWNIKVNRPDSGANNWVTCRNFDFTVNGSSVFDAHAFSNAEAYNGNGEYITEPLEEINAYDGTVIAYGKFNIEHTDDGTLTLNMAAEMEVATINLGINSTGTKTFDLDTIVRRSLLIVDKPQLDLNETLTCSFSVYHPDVKHVVDYKLNGNSYLIDEWVSASGVVEWVPGDYFGEKIPGSSGAYCEVRCHTYYNDECIGTDSVTVYVSIPQDCEPDLSLSVSMVDASGGLLRGGEWVKNNCKAKLTFVNRPKYGAQPAYSNLVGPGIDIRGLPEAEGTYTTDIITQAGTATWSYSANDTRNTWNECSVSVNVLDSMIIAVICDGAGKVTRYIPMIHNGTDYVEYTVDISGNSSAVEETVYTVDASGILSNGGNAFYVDADQYLYL